MTVIALYRTHRVEQDTVQGQYFKISKHCSNPVHPIRYHWMPSARFGHRTSQEKRWTGASARARLVISPTQAVCTFLHFSDLFQATSLAHFHRRKHNKQTLWNTRRLLWRGPRWLTTPSNKHGTYLFLRPCQAANYLSHSRPAQLSRWWLRSMIWSEHTRLMHPNPCVYVSRLQCKQCISSQFFYNPVLLA